MYPHLYERIDELLASGAPVAVADMVGWVDFREKIVMTYEELSDALGKLRAARRIELTDAGYQDSAAPGPFAEFRLPTRDEYEKVIGEYTSAGSAGDGFPSL
jgi:hypothetical protein